MLLSGGLAMLADPRAAVAYNYSHNFISAARTFLVLSAIDTDIILKSANLAIWMLPIAKGGALRLDAPLEHLFECRK